MPLSAELSPFENLPDELLSRIAEVSWADLSYRIAVNVEPRLRAFQERSLNANPLYHITLVSKSLRKVYLPWLFRDIIIVYVQALVFLSSHFFKQLLAT
jgi:hypothetical protein